MTTNSPSASERRDDVSDRSEQQTLARTVGADLATRDWVGIAAAVAGGALLVRGLRAARERRGRGLLQVFVGGALLAFGYARRGSDDDRSGDRSDEASADAHVELERPDTDRNPRDVSEDPEVSPSSEDEGGVQFTDDRTDDLDGGPDADGEPGAPDEVEVDISEAAMADEPGEAAGPTSAQAEPTTTKTDQSPPTGGEEPDVDDGLESGLDRDAAADGDDVADGDEVGDTVETEGGTEVHTDTVESGTTDIAEEDVTGGSGEPTEDAQVEELGDDETADYQAPGGDEGSDETEEAEDGAEVHTDTVESGTIDIDEEDVEGDADGGQADEDED